MPPWDTEGAVQPFGSPADGFRKPHVELMNKTSVKVEDGMGDDGRVAIRIF